MKNFYLPITVLIPIVLMAGCSTFPLYKNESWLPGEIDGFGGSVRIVSVTVERSGEAASLEKEASAILPLLFSEESFHVVSSPIQEETEANSSGQAEAKADFSALVYIREREYPEGWHTQRSLSVEIRLWAGEDIDALPLSAGRSLVQGRKSLASSRTLSAMLRRAVKKAVGGIAYNDESAGDVDK